MKINKKNKLKKFIILVIFSVFILLCTIIIVIYKFSTQVLINENKPIYPTVLQNSRLVRNILTVKVDPNYFGKKTTTYYNWPSAESTFNFVRDWWNNNFETYIHYNLVDTIEYNDFPVKEDGFKYTQDSYKLCVDNNSTCHKTDIINYQKFFSDLNLCAKVNSGEIDEIWMIGGPWIGFLEATMTGPNGFNLNGGPFTSSCNKKIPVMGFNYIVGVGGNSIEDFTHRQEGTMEYLYKGWHPDTRNTNWDLYTNNNKDTSNYTSYGCGWSHYPANGTRVNKIYVNSFCDEFLNYPSININNVKSLNCDTWGCNQIQFFFILV